MRYQTVWSLACFVGMSWQAEPSDSKNSSRMKECKDWRLSPIIPVPQDIVTLTVYRMISSTLSCLVVVASWTCLERYNGQILSVPEHGISS